MTFNKKESGFSIVDLIITMAIIGIISVTAIPSLKEWSKNYNVQSAAMDLYSHMQAAKLGSIKENKEWSINFAPEGIVGYQVIHKVNNVDQAVKTVDFGKRYNGEIQYAHPTETTSYDAPTISFLPNGLIKTTNVGYVYISNKSKSSYYRVGMPYASSSVKIEKRDGTQWK